MAKKAEKKEVKAWHYDVVVKPLITEKATMVSEHNKVIFEVPLESSKGDIKQAIEALYKVSVVKVNTLIRKGKTKRFRGFVGTRSDTKKAIVTLKKGDSIDLMTGV